MKNKNRVLTDNHYMNMDFVHLNESMRMQKMPKPAVYKNSEVDI